MLTLPFGTWLLCVTTLVWYLTTVSYHVRLVLSTESVPHTLCYHVSLVPVVTTLFFYLTIVSLVPDHCVTTLFFYLTIVCYRVRLTPDYGVLPRAFGIWLWCVTTLVWYLTTVCCHVLLVPDDGVLPRSFGIEYRECSPYVLLPH